MRNFDAIPQEPQAQTFEDLRPELETLVLKDPAHITQKELEVLMGKLVALPHDVNVGLSLASLEALHRRSLGRSQTTLEESIGNLRKVLESKPPAQEAA
jgi:hypothetical protein